MARNFAEAVPLPAKEQHSITFVYKTRLPQTCQSVMVTWSKDLADHSLCISVENSSQQNAYNCKIDSIFKQSWGKKGLKTLEIQGNRVDIFWDFRHAKFTSYPRPRSDYYVILVHRKETLLFLGDLEKEAYERTRSRPCSEEAVLLYKKEIVYGKKMFCTKAMIEEGKTEHDIVIETSLSGPEDPEMWVSIDGIVATRIMNLNWRFRGNETVIVNNLPVHILWDVHDWLFNGSGHGLFIFKPGSLESAEDDSDSGDRDCCPEDSPTSEGCCHFLYAWNTN
ncbi:uncharacterized protein LOC114745168 [Neltuma alba]|uniref:uncharacterized protein LOC114728754 n=1 Tax=Neltuma alba TaxID=207710 RepID=UPI0010A2FAF8|nr:uncharacterized protein LOC114728754 [Prosopis alba]XP_028789153.1 uncharacterized protein LOC114745168 [Prosopis alba]